MSTIIDMDLECDSMTDAAAAASPPPKLTTIDQLQKIMLPPRPDELSISRRRDWLNLFSRYLPETNGRLLESQLAKMHKYLPDAVTSGFDEFLENVKRYRRVPVTTKAAGSADDDESNFTGPNTYGTRIMALLNDSTSLPDMSNFTISSSAAAVAAAAASINNNNNESGSDNDNADFEPPSSSSSDKKKGKKAVKQIVPLENKAIMDMDDVAAASSSSSRVSGSKRRRANILSENVKLVPSRWNVGTVMNMGGRRLLGSIQAYIRRALEIRQIKSKLELKVARKEIQDDALLFVLLRKMIVYAPFNPAYDNNGAFALVMAQMANAASFTRKDNAASTTMCVACFENTPFRTGSDKDIRSGTSQMCSFSINSYIVPPKNSSAATASKTKYFTACREHATLIEQWRDLFLFNNLAPFFEQLNAQMVTNTIKSIATAMKNVELRSLSWEMPVLLQPLPHVLLEMSDAGALCELIADASWWSNLKPSAPSSGQRPPTTEPVSSMEVEPVPKAITLPAKRTAAVAAAPVVVVEAEVESEPEFELAPAPAPAPAPVVVSAKLARFAYAGKGKQEVPEEVPAPAPATKFADDDFDSLFL